MEGRGRGRAGCDTSFPPAPADPPNPHCPTACADKEPRDKDGWGRVVAVVCLGKAWQFKKWPFKVGWHTPWQGGTQRREALGWACWWVLAGMRSSCP